MSDLIAQIDEIMPKINEVIDSNQNAFVYHDKIAWAIYTLRQYMRDCKTEIESLETALDTSNLVRKEHSEKIKLLTAELAKAKEYVPMDYEEMDSFCVFNTRITRPAMMLDLQKEFIKRANLVVKE